MRDIIQQVDELLEGLFNGDVVSGVYDPEYMKMMGAVTGDAMKPVINEWHGLFDKLIPEYMSAKDQAKIDTAFKIFHSVMLLRRMGMMRNNPNSSKEVNFYRARAMYFEDKNKELTETVMALRAGKSGIE